MSKHIIIYLPESGDIFSNIPKILTGINNFISKLRHEYITIVLGKVCLIKTRKVRDVHSIQVSMLRNPDCIVNKPEEILGWGNYTENILIIISDEFPRYSHDIFLRKCRELEIRANPSWIIYHFDTTNTLPELKHSLTYDFGEIDQCIGNLDVKLYIPTLTELII